MKIILSIVFIAFVGFCNAQVVDTIPESYLINIHGHKIDTKKISNHGKPFIISFWASWQKNSLLELNNIHDVYKYWNKESGVKVFAISVDDPETYEDVKRYAQHHKWEFDVLIDENHHFEDKIHVNGVPHTLLYDGSGKVVWQKHSYSSGDENDLHNELEKLSAQ